MRRSPLLWAGGDVQMNIITGHVLACIEVTTPLMPMKASDRVFGMPTLSMLSNGTIPACKNALRQSWRYILLWTGPGNRREALSLTSKLIAPNTKLVLWMYILKDATQTMYAAELVPAAHVHFWQMGSFCGRMCCILLGPAAARQVKLQVRNDMAKGG